MLGGEGEIQGSRVNPHQGCSSCFLFGRDGSGFLSSLGAKDPKPISRGERKKPDRERMVFVEWMTGTAGVTVPCARTPMQLGKAGFWDRGGRVDWGG